MRHAGSLARLLGQLRPVRVGVTPLNSPGSCRGSQGRLSSVGGEGRREVGGPEVARSGRRCRPIRCNIYVTFQKGRSTPFNRW